MKHSLAQQLSAVDAAILMMRGGVRPTPSERAFLQNILETVKARIEAAIDRERANGKR